MAIDYTIKGWFQQTERRGTGEVWWAGVTQDSPIDSKQVSMKEGEFCFYQFLGGGGLQVEVGKA
jgi:hypothetical protein